MPVTTLCADCQTNVGNLDVRKRRLCHDCFMKYVTLKVHKRMEPYRVMNEVGDTRRSLLLPLSGGPSSLACLVLIDAHLKRQMEKRKTTAYDLVLLHVCLTDNKELAGRDPAWFEALKSKYPQYEYLQSVHLTNVISFSDGIESDLKELGINRADGENDEELIQRLFSSTKTATSSADLQVLILQRLIVGVAKKRGCESILWGHSDSRLAAKALADVAKGRGGAVPNGIADGPSPYGLNFNFPLRDLFHSELELYLQCLSEDHSSCLSPESSQKLAAVSVRNTSIDQLLSGYIFSQSEKYPGIMANVVRTASKLQIQTIDGNQRCKLCFTPAVGSTKQKPLCYGCERMRTDIKT